MNAGSPQGAPVVAIILAHDQPVALERLAQALDPIPILLHVDANTPEPLATRLYAAVDPHRCRRLPRRHCQWASKELLAAELDGYRLALSDTTADHFIVLTGTDYPLAGSTELIARLAVRKGQTFGQVFGLPSRNWMPFGGWDRVLVPQRAKGRRRQIIGPPRCWPRGVRPSGGSQQKIIARHHVAQILRALDTDPRLWPFFSTCWIPDEVAIPSLLRSSRLTGIDWPKEYAGEFPWLIDWGRGRRPSPRWLEADDFAMIARARRTGALFTRKICGEQVELPRRIQAELW